MKIDKASRSCAAEARRPNTAKPSRGFYFNLHSKNSAASRLITRTGIRLPQPFPPPAPPPTRESSVENLATSNTIRSRETLSRVDVTPRKLPEFRSCRVLAGGTSFIKSSGIRETLPHIKKLETGKQLQVPLADIILSSGCPIRTDHPEKLNAQGYHTERELADEPGDEVKKHEQDAVQALLVLKQCSLQVADMTKDWSQFNKVPLCDFIVAQKKCQSMLENIETLKDTRVQVREATAVEEVYGNDAFFRHALFEKRRRLGTYRPRSEVKPSRSSSIISIVNVVKKEKENEPRSQSASSECTVTKSPTQVDCEISQPVEPRPPLHFTTTYDEPGSGIMSSSDEVKKVMGKIGKTSKSGKNRNTHMKCLQCSATDTPEWRKGPVGPTTLCNACGLFYKKLLKRFGGDTADVIMKMRQTKNPQDRKVPRSLMSG